jgi:uncharacterized membrane protein YbhN (UPF0104 family)
VRPSAGTSLPADGRIVAQQAPDTVRGIEPSSTELTTGSSADEAEPRQRRSMLKLLAGLLVGGLATWVVVSTAGGLGDAFAAIRSMRGSFVILAVVLSVVRLGLFALQLLWLGRRTGTLTARVAIGLGLVVYGFGAVTPAAPAEGLAIASRELRRRGRTKQQARMICGFSEWFAQRTFYGVAALDLIAVVALGHLPSTDSWPVLVVAGLVLALLAGTAYAARRPSTAIRAAALLGAIRLRRPQPPPEARAQSAGAWHAQAMEIAGPPSHRLRLAAATAGAVLADAAILWATCHAAGFDVHPELVLLARTVGTVVSWVPLLPGGLGLVEAAIPTVLHRFGAPLDAALAATLVYRAIGTLLPALAGTAAIVALRRFRTAPAAPGASS